MGAELVCCCLAQGGYQGGALLSACFAFAHRGRPAEREEGGGQGVSRGAANCEDRALSMAGCGMESLFMLARSVTFPYISLHFLQAGPEGHIQAPFGWQVQVHAGRREGAQELPYNAVCGSRCA